ncbi:MAG: hypothetical protein RLY84_810 [Actinomycetota bacterium]
MRLLHSSGLVCWLGLPGVLDALLGYANAEQGANWIKKF